MPGPHPPEFRRRAVELARELDEDGNRKYPIATLARDLKISESCLRNWLAADAVEAGEKPGLTKAEREELVRLPRCAATRGTQDDRRLAGARPTSPPTGRSPPAADGHGGPARRRDRPGRPHHGSPGDSPGAGRSCRRRTAGGARHPSRSRQ